MRILLAVVIAAALGWSAYWMIGARGTERALTTWFDMRAEDGWVAYQDGIGTRGFPNRFDTTITDIELADPGTGVAWRAPFFQILALSYKPHHVIAVWPDSQTIATPNQTIELESDVFRGSVVFEPGINLTLDHSTIEFDALSLASSADWAATLERGQLSTRHTAGTENAHDIYFEARNLTLPLRLRESLTQTELVGDTVQTLKVDSTIGFTAPWDRYAIEVARPQVTDIHLKLVQGTWGALDLKIAGRLAVDASGTPEGEITVKATNWREMLEIANAAGLVPPQLRGLMEGGLNMVARLSGNRDTIDAPLVFKDGTVTLGGLLPLGPAPTIVLR